MSPVQTNPGKTIQDILKDTDPTQTAILVSIVLDESGSMQACQDATISGFNEYLTTLRQLNGTVQVTLTKFNTQRTEVVYAGRPLNQVPDLDKTTYKPVDGTPLYDAIASTIHANQQALKKTHADQVLCVIITDGEENSSKQYTREKIVKLMKSCESNGWTFVYLGANQDAWAIGQTLGMAKANTMSYTYASTDSAIRMLGQATMCYAAQSSTCAKGEHVTNFFGKDTVTLTDKDAMHQHPKDSKRHSHDQS